MDWDDAYSNMAHIPGAEALPGQWQAAASAYRDRVKALAQWDIPYGKDPRERLDLILPEARPLGLVVFVHGGYWMATDKSVWSHLAHGAQALGWAVALPSYPLAPEARLGQMARAIARAIEVAAGHVAGPIRLAGHSAGGHLASRIACENNGLSTDVAGRISHVLSISGLHDLRPLMRTAMNQTLAIDEAEALSESPALLRPAGMPVTAWVGADERPVFIKQTMVLSAIWAGLGAPVREVIEDGMHHFSILDGLEDPQSPITRALIGDQS